MDLLGAQKEQVQPERWQLVLAALGETREVAILSGANTATRHLNQLVTIGNEVQRSYSVNLP